MFKAYASTVDEKNEDRKPTENNNNNANTWLENKSFAIEPPTIFPSVSSQRQTTTPVQSKEIKSETKLPIKKPSESKPLIKQEPPKDTFYVDRRRDRANLTVQYTHGIPRYGVKFCNQRALGSRETKSSRKQRITRYFHQKFDDTDNHPSDNFVRVDEQLETLNRTVREQPHLFDAWKDLIHYQFYLYKTTTDQDQLLALYNKQLSIIDRAVELNSNRLQYRLLQLNLRCQSHLFNSDLLLSEWKNLRKDSLKSSDDRTINEIWSSYIQFHLNHIEIFSIEGLHEIFQDFISTYLYHLQTKSEKGRRYLIDHMLDTLHIWTCVLREAGYVERGLSIFQAMLNINTDFNEKNFQTKVQSLEQNWNTDRRRFGENHVPEDLTSYIETELQQVSQQENQLFDSTFRSWLTIEQLRCQFYQSKFVNQSIHFYSKCLQTLDDPSQLDDEIVNLSFTRHIRPFLFQLLDQRQLIQLIIYYLNFVNGLPEFTIVQELVNKLKITLTNSFHDQIFLEQEFNEFTRLVQSKPIERQFSFEYISNIYEQIIALPVLKTYQIEIILFYWYFVAEDLRQVKQQDSSLYKIRLKSFQNLIKKYLSLDEYRTCLRLYTHYARIESEYLQRRTESRRIFDLCYQTIRTNAEQYSSFDSSIDLCHWLTTNLRCEFNFHTQFDTMKKIVFNNQKYLPLKQDFNSEKFCSLINFVLKKLFPTTEYNDIISLILNCLKNDKISKWDQSSTDNNWSNYLRQNPSVSFELLFLFLNYSYLLNDPFEKLHQIVTQSILPLITDQHRKFHQTMIDSIIRFYLLILWNELFTERLLFSQCTNYLKEFFDKISYPSIILLTFTSIYTCLLPLYGNYVKEFEQTMLNYESNKKIEYRLINKYFVFQMNFNRHFKIQKSNLINEKIQSGYEHRVRHILRQLVQEYPSYRHLWNFYLAFEYSSVNSQRLKGILYDAMQNCPWAKTFYLQSISQASNEPEWKLFVNVMLRSNLHILFSIEEYDLMKELFDMKT